MIFDWLSSKQIRGVKCFLVESGSIQNVVLVLYARFIRLEITYVYDKYTCMISIINITVY